MAYVSNNMYRYLMLKGAVEVLRCKGLSDTVHTRMLNKDMDYIMGCLDYEEQAYIKNLNEREGQLKEKPYVCKVIDRLGEVEGRV